MVGSALVRNIKQSDKHNWIGADRNQLDLRDRQAVFDFIGKTRPDAVIISAAKVGGILANSKFPVDFLSDNILMQTNLLDASYEYDVQRVVFLGSSCIYPKFTEQPIRPDSLMTAPLEETNEAYAIAKISGVKLVQAYRRQYGKSWISIMPTNLYGPGDNYHLENSHVIPAIVRKISDAKNQGEKTVSLFGTGRPLREFLHVDDLASGVMIALEHFDDGVPLNIGSGEEISIKNLAEMIAELSSYKGQLNWDTSRPDGTPRKLLDSSNIRSLGWKPAISLEQGLRGEIEEYETQALQAKSEHR